MVRARSGLWAFLLFLAIVAPRPSMLTAQEKEAPPSPLATSDAAAPDGALAPAQPAWWKRTPPVRVFPRLGFFFVPPSGPGHYSALDWLRGDYRDKPPRFPYPPSANIAFSFFDADFRYLDDPKNTQHDWADCLHRVHLGDCWLFATGGEFRWRHVNDSSARLTGVSNSYDLLRTRVFTDLWHQDRLRVYVEFHDAHSFNQNLAPLPIDVNRSDLLNAFADIKLGDWRNHPVYLRAGRQELLLGSERLISPLDWANSRRTFNGVRAFRQGEKFDVDLFWTQPVPPDPSNFDSVDNNQNFAGLWTTYRAEKGRFLDLYYLFLDNTNVTTRLGIETAPFNVHTLGFRSIGDEKGWLWEVETMLQLGRRGSADILAGACTLGGGRHWQHLPWNPTVWLYYDYASGDDNPNQGGYHTFNQLFAFGHYYLGIMDLVGRQNLHDLNAHLYLYPANWISLNMQYHCFRLDQARDALYNAAGLATRRAASGAAGRDVGQELDLVVNFHLTTHLDVQIGYAHFFAGEFIRGTGSELSSDFLYLMTSFRW